MEQFLRLEGNLNRWVTQELKKRRDPFRAFGPQESLSSAQSHHGIFVVQQSLEVGGMSGITEPREEACC
jgi:hypothetical protein